MLIFEEMYKILKLTYALMIFINLLKYNEIIAYMLIIYFLFILVHWPLKIDFSNTELVGLEGARNFYLHTDQQVKIGAW